jgi:uncharacterized membrane-anchored protein
MSRLRIAIALAGLALVLAVANRTIWAKQQIVEHGRAVLLALRPVDPRSLMQGDYMTLALHAEALPPAPGELPRRGTAVLRLDDSGVGRFVRIDDGSPLAADEMRVGYKRLGRFGAAEISYGAESFLFQEGDADLYAAARYAVLHVDDAGGTVLVGLADTERRRIAPPPR